MIFAPGSHLGPYEVIELLGRGGFGEVYRARDPRLARDVAVKVLRLHADGDHLRRFEREARAAAAVIHPNVIAVLDVGTTGDVPYVVTELVEGESLRTVLNQRRLTLSEALEYAVQIADALEAAHAKGIVHRDLKPENILLASPHRIKVVDFGLAKIIDPAAQSAIETAPALTERGDLLGTPAYAAPEQLRGDTVDHRADIFSFGVVLYEMLTGRRPFDGQTTADAITAILRDPPAALPKELAAIPALDTMLRRALEKDARARFQSVSDLRFVLGTIVSPPAPRRPMHRAVPGLAAVIAVLLVVAVIWLPRLRDNSASVPPPGAVETRRQEIVAVPSRLMADARVLPRRLGRLFGTAGIAVKAAEAGRIEISGSAEQIESVKSALSLADALRAVKFAEEPGVRTGDGALPLFSGSGQSKTRVSLSVRDVERDALLHLIAWSAGWPVVMDDGVTGVVSLDLKDLPWDLLVRSCLTFGGASLAAVRMGDVWLVSSHDRIAAATSERLYTWIKRSRTISTRDLARLLEPARSDRGLIVVNERLDAVIVVDYYDAFPTYARILSAVDRVPVETLAVPRPSNRYAGARISTTMDRVSTEAAIRTLAEIAGLNVVMEPRVSSGGTPASYGRLSAVLADTRWDNTLQVMLAAAGLAYSVNGSVLHVTPKESPPEPIVETIALKRESPEFFQPFAKYLSPRGSISVESRQRLIVIRDIPERLRLFQSIVQIVDARQP